MKKTIYILILLAGVFFMTSCDDFLDKSPDNRVENLDTPEKIRKLLVSAYAETSPIYMLETFSDNTDMNVGNYSEWELMQTEAFYWRDITSQNNNDNPTIIWEDYYRRAATANLVLQAIEELGNPAELDAHRGEAYICRAYAHFSLVTIFSKMYSNTSSTDLGIPYATKVETTVKPYYERGTLDETYAAIARDIETALPLIDDALYNVPKFHFNKKAAYAFAARFYLYYRKFDKVVEYANEVLGTDDATTTSLLRDWKGLGEIGALENRRGDEYISVASAANLLIHTSYSLWPLMIAPYTGAYRYTHNEIIAENETTAAPGPWGSAKNYYLTGSNWIYPLVSSMRLFPYREILDPIAGSSYYHMLCPVFNTDETLLCRAEAYTLLGASGQLTNGYERGLADFNLFMRNFYKEYVDLDKEALNEYYGNVEYYTPNAPTPKKALNPDFNFQLDKDHENLIHAILQVRRVLTIHEGLRWNDVNRYGIRIYRRAVDQTEKLLEDMISVVDVLEPGDDRRAIQLPANVIDAGLEANPRRN